MVAACGARTGVRDLEGASGGAGDGLLFLEPLVLEGRASEGEDFEGCFGGEGDAERVRRGDDGERRGIV